MLTALLGLCTAITYGAADFFAAIASRKVRVVVVTALASLTGLIVLLALTPVLGAKFSDEAFFWGLMGGFSSVVALLALYASLALGPISIVSPLGALLSAIVPAVIGVALLGENFSFVGWRPKPRAFILAIFAGTGIGLVFTALARSPHDSGIAPIIVMRTTASVLLGAIVLFGMWRGQKASAAENKEPLDRKIWLTVAGAGGLDAMANIFFTLASRTGSLTVTGVLTALYPLGTIILARIVLKEHVAGIQKIGIALTLGASLLLALA